MKTYRIIISRVEHRTCSIEAKAENEEAAFLLGQEFIDNGEYHFSNMDCVHSEDDVLEVEEVTKA